MSEVFWRYLPQTRRPKFTVVEYIIIVAFLAVASRVALPFVMEYRDDRRARSVLAVVMELETAARQAAEAGDLAALTDLRQCILECSPGSGLSGTVAIEAEIHVFGVLEGRSSIYFFS